MLNGRGALLSAELYHADEVVPGTVFAISELEVNTKENAMEIVLPAHSIAQIRMQLAEK